MLIRLVKQRKHYLSFARKSFKNQETIKWKREAGNILQKREGFSQMGGLESLQFVLRTILVKTFQLSYISNIQKGCLYEAAKQKAISISILKSLS